MYVKLFLFPGEMELGSIAHLNVYLVTDFPYLTGGLNRQAIRRQFGCQSKPASFTVPELPRRLSGINRAECTLSFESCS